MKSERPNVLLIVLDSVRARNMSLYGYHNETTPFLSSFASSATVYEHTISPGMWSLPSHVSIFTGYEAAAHGIRNRSKRLPSGHSIFEKLRNKGYDTGVFSENPFLVNDEWGLTVGFDHVSGAPDGRWFPDALQPGKYKNDPKGFARAALQSGKPIRSLLNGTLDKLLWDYPRLVPNVLAKKSSAGNINGSNFTDEFLSWQAGREKPWAACINYMDAHHPYYPNEESDQWGGHAITDVRDSIDSIPVGFYDGTDPWWKFELLEHLYDGTIRQLDEELNRLVSTLKHRDELDDTLFVVVGDHGEGFGDQSRVKDELRIGGHNVGVHESLFHVPLLVRRPRQSSGNRVSKLATLTGFSNVVHQVVSDFSTEFSSIEYNNEDPFVSDDQVRVVGDVGTATNDKIRQVLDENKYPNNARVVYKDVNGYIQKHIVWGEDTISLRVIDAQTSYQIDADSQEIVERAFDDVDPLELSVSAGSENSDIEKQLADLGYL